MKYKIFFHNDLDGYASGYIIKKFIKKNYGNPEIELIECNYSSNFQNDIINKTKIDKNDTIFIVDYSFDTETMKNIHTIVKNNLIWIDHHITAIQKMSDMNDTINGIRSIKNSGVYLSYQYCFGEEKTPLWVKLIDIFDCWKKNDQFDWDTIIIPFKYALESSNINFADDNNVWNDLDNEKMDFVKNLIMDGNVIKNFLDKKYIAEAKNKSYTIEFEGCRALTINNYGSGSLSLESTFDPTIHDIMLTYSINKDKTINVGLYTMKDEFHVGNIAKKYGGGGHSGAAGFSISLDEIGILF